MQKLLCYTSGRAKGNPGPAAIGVYITDEDGGVVAEMGNTIGNSTGDFAHYQAVMVALQTLQSQLGTASTTTEIVVSLDSQFVQSQLSATAPIQEPGFVPMFIEIHNMRVTHFPYLTFSYLSSEQNNQAERLANEALNVI